MLDPLAELLAAAPSDAQPFPDTEYPLPVQLALYGQVPAVRWLGDQLRQAESPVAGLEAALALAEAVESVAPDRLEYFVGDAKTRGLVFTGAKWRAGWALLVGEDVTEEFIQQVVDREFLVFVANPPTILKARAVPLPHRATGLIYFLQVAVRYGLIYGRIPAGEAHELSHFLEDDVPGVVVARGQLSPLESYLILGLMKLGIPAVVPADFPYPQGRQARTDDPDEALREMSRFPNLRVREVDGRTVRLPSYADPAHAAEDFQPARRFGGPNSFLFVHHDPAARDGEVVVGQLPATLEGCEIGIVVSLAAEGADDAICELLEGRARAALRSLKGIRPTDGVARGAFGLELSADAAVRPDQWVEVIRRSLQFHYPRIGEVAVRVSFDADELAGLAPTVRREITERRARVTAQAEVDPDVYYACTDCQPFSREHVCIVAPNRPPMCGRDWRDIAAGALFGVGYFPYKRRGDAARPNERPIEAGQCLDRARGEFAGVNQAVRELSHGAIERVYLHSVRERPHTSCGCFHHLAFWIEEVGGLGVMHRGFPGRAPNGETWDRLANRAGGKQFPGVTGIGPAYLPLSSFLRGDGGIENVVWMTRKARDAAGLRAAGIATEDEVVTLADLVEQLTRRRRGLG